MHMSHVYYLICLRVPSEYIYLMEREYPTSCTLLEHTASSVFLVCSLSVVIKISLHVVDPDKYTVLITAHLFSEM